MKSQNLHTIKKTLIYISLIVVFLYLVLNLIVGNKHYEKIISYFPDEYKQNIEKIFFPLKKITNLQNKIIRLNENIEYLNSYLDRAKPYGEDILIKKNLSDLNFEKIKSEFNFNGKKIKIEKFQNLNPFLRGIYRDMPGSAYIEVYENKLFIISTIGIFGYSKINKNEENLNFKQIDNNFNDFLNINHFRRNKTYAVRDLKIYNDKIFVSYNEEVKQDCWATGLLWAELNFKEINFKKLFSPKECVEENNIDGEFNASQSGGRIAFIDNENLVLSIGDYRLRFLPQNKNSLFGKIIKFNLKEKKITLISMGHRNPQGLIFDEDKNILISTEHGPRGGDEINIIKLEQNLIPNYGWPIASYGEHYPVKEAHGDTADESKNIEKYKKYPLLKSHNINGFVEPIEYFVPSIGPSQIIKINETSYFFTSLRDKSLYYFQLDEENKLKNEIERFKIGERIRDITKYNDTFYMYLEDTGSIVKFTIKN